MMKQESGERKPVLIIAENTKNLLLIFLTCAAGSMDALSLLGLGMVFTSSLSGNTVLLGISLVQGQFGEAALRGIVFVGYILGAALCSLLLRRQAVKFQWSVRVTQTLVIETFVLLVLLLGIAFTGSHFFSLSVLIFLSSFAMGIQYMSARQVNSSGVATTIVTSPIMSLVSHFINREQTVKSRSTNSLETSKKSKIWSLSHLPERSSAFLVAIWGAYFLGAAASAIAILNLSRTAAALIPFSLVLVVVLYAGINQMSYRSIQSHTNT